MLYYLSRSEDFIAKTNAYSVMLSMSVPAVFSFSISYHIMTVYGCISRAGARAPS